MKSRFLSAGMEGIMKDKTVWKYLEKNVSADDVEKWLSEMDYEPYKYDPVLQSIAWVKDLTAAIQKVAPLVGDGLEIEYRFWSNLKNWEFILNCFSIARALGGMNIIEKKFGWQSAIEQLKFWADSLTSHTNTQNFVYGGPSFFRDVVQFFWGNRKLINPKKLAKEVQEYKLEKKKG